MAKRLVIGIAILLAVAAVFLWWLSPAGEKTAGSKADVSITRDVQASQLAELVDGLWNGRDAGHEALADKLDRTPNPVYLAARREGRRLAHTWQAGNGTHNALVNAIEEVKKEILEARGAERVDVLELVFAYGFENASYGQRGWMSNIYRGVKGIELRYGDVLERYSPTYTLATNRKASRLIDLFRRRHGLTPAQLRSEVGYRTFEADQWLVKLAGAGRQTEAVRMERGNEFVPIEAVTQANVSQFGRLATDWLANNLDGNGRLMYKYWPSARRESTSNNMIRQWMATVAMIRAAKHWQDETLMQRAAANIDYNLSQFYHEENGYGLIEFRNKVKLGAVALAALALAEHPQRSRWQAQEAAMQRTIRYLWRDDGSFRTFYKPANRNDVQNFYPGEALLYLATLYEDSRDEAMLERIMASFRYYRDWHLDKRNRNPAFIPWHTQAYYKIWRLTGNKELRDFVFTMNDWLIDQMQQWEGEVLYRDTLGRFYNPRRRFGPPHASSTGVYMEGLIDAFEMARSGGDATREARYRTAIQRGLRSVMQLQFVDEVDMFYVPVSLRSKVKGGIRTTVYDNEIRCDNVQHNLMAVLKILRGFKSEDYPAEQDDGSQ